MLASYGSERWPPTLSASAWSRLIFPSAVAHTIFWCAAVTRQFSDLVAAQVAARAVPDERRGDAGGRLGPKVAPRDGEQVAALGRGSRRRACPRPPSTSRSARCTRGRWYDELPAGAAFERALARSAQSRCLPEPSTVRHGPPARATVSAHDAALYASAAAPAPYVTLGSASPAGPKFVPRSTTLSPPAVSSGSGALTTTSRRARRVEPSGEHGRVLHGVRGRADAHAPEELAPTPRPCGT